jgi:ABC-type proline/glycine betaine transport system substrate-binding protein
MKRVLLPLALVLGTMTSAALAAEPAKTTGPVQLTDAQLDRVHAGARLTVTSVCDGGTCTATVVSGGQTTTYAAGTGSLRVVCTNGACTFTSP